MVCLVTGGSGFLGSRIVRELADRGKKVVSTDSFIREEVMSNAPKSVRFVQCDVCSLKGLLDVSNKFDIDSIFHMAYLLVPQTERDLAGAVRVNIEGMKNILELARKIDVERVVWPSSVAVYGQSNVDDNVKVTEESPRRPMSFYGACKVFNEEMGKHYREAYGVNNIALRYGSVYGPGRSRGFTAFIVDLIEKPALGKAVTIELGDELVNWLYVTDAVEATMSALSRRNLSHNVYNITGSVKTVRDVVAYVKRLLPKTKINLKPGSTGRQVRMDGRRASRELNYKPKYTVETGVLEHINILRTQHGLSKL